MKYFLLCCLGFLYACGERHYLDQEITADSFEEQLRIIAEHEDYDPLVYLRAEYMFGDGMAEHKTFRQLLEEAKEINEDYDRKTEKYERDLKEYSQLFSVRFSDGFLVPYEDSLEEDPEYPEYYAYSYQYTTKNNSDKGIVKYRGVIYLMEPTEQFYLIKLPIEDETSLASGSERPVREVVPLGERDDLERLRSIPSEELVPVWEVETIHFEDGTSLEVIPVNESFNEYHRSYKK